MLLALEAERDNEAVASGVAPEDLAEAIIAAARLQCGHPAAAWAQAAGDGAGIAWRVRRLLSGAVETQRVFWSLRVSCVSLLAFAVWAGLHYGDDFLGLLPGMGP